MAKQTPEGKVKKRLLDFLKTFGSDCFYYMPVQNGMGQTGIPDVMAILYGVPLAIETKATPKQHPTTLQAMALERIHNAGGIAWVVDNESIGLAEKLIRNVDPDGEYNRGVAETLSHEESLAPLYRWRSKLEVVEFGDGTGS